MNLKDANVAYILSRETSVKSIKMKRHLRDCMHPQRIDKKINSLY